MIARFASQQPHTRAWARLTEARARRHDTDVLKASPQARVTTHHLLTGITAVYLVWLIYHRLFNPNWLRTLPAGFQELFWLSELAGAFTLALVWLALLWLRRTPLPLPDAPPPATIVPLSINELYDLSPRAFEEYVAQLFRQKGYHVTMRGRSGDHGVDLELTQSNGRRAIVQCKRYRSAIGPEVVRELYGTLIHERAAHAFLVTTADISESARRWAQGKPMTLIDGRTLDQIAATLAK